MLRSTRILFGLCVAIPALALDNGPAPPRAEPVQETKFGVAVEDPYRWMESRERAAEWTDWVKRSSAHTRAQLGTAPGRAGLVDAMRKADASGVRYLDAWRAGPRFFARRLDPGTQQPKLIVLDGGRERVLFDPATMGERVAINSYSVSPDGRTVAVHTSTGGAEIGAIHFFDVASGARRPGEVSPVWGEFTAEWFSPTQIVVTMLDKEKMATDPSINMHAHLYRVGDAGVGAPVLGAGVADAPAMDPSVFPIVVASPNSRWVLGLGANARADALVYVALKSDIAAGRPRWRQIATYDDAATDATLFGDSAYVLTTHGSPNGRLLELSLAGGAALSTAGVVLPEGDLVLGSVTAARDGIYVASHRDGIAHLLYLPKGKDPAAEVPLPVKGTVVALRASRDGEAVSFALTDWFHPSRIFTARAGHALPAGLDSVGYAGVSALVEQRVEATSADGTKVPMAIIMRRDLGARPNAPAIVNGYSGYGISTLEPRYASLSFAFAEAGGVWAYCGARGGGERGRSWHEGGRAANKPNAHADVIACGERLVELGISSPGRMTVRGASMGGALMGPTGLKRPDLFRSAVLEVGILNPTRLEVAANGANQYGEMGDPSTEAGFKGMLLQDAYQMLAAAKDMPDTLLTIGLNDNRVAPWMSAKYAARALSKFGDKHLVLIRADTEQGHGIGSGRELVIQEYADVYSFVFNRAAQ
jgi:prolyl oligopeptidase